MSEEEGRTEYVKFRLDGAHSESRSSYMNMPKARYCKLLCPFLGMGSIIQSDGLLPEGCLAIERASQCPKYQEESECGGDYSEEQYPD